MLRIGADCRWLGRAAAGAGGPVAKILADAESPILTATPGLWLERRYPHELDKNNRYGFTYRSEVRSTSTVTTAAACRQPITRSSATSVCQQVLMAKTTDGSLTFNLPEMGAVGYNCVAPQWAVHYSLTYTSWSQFQELKATGSNGQTLFYKEEGFKDAYRLALGTTLL